MDYFILPTNFNNIIIINNSIPTQNEHQNQSLGHIPTPTPSPFISQSLFSYNNNMKMQIIHCLSSSLSSSSNKNELYKHLINYIHPYNFFGLLDKNKENKENKYNINDQKVIEINDYIINANYKLFQNSNTNSNNEIKDIKYNTIFYDMIENLYTLNILSYINKQNPEFIKTIHIDTINSSHITDNEINNYQYLDIFRNNKKDIHFYLPHFKNKIMTDYKFDYIFSNIYNPLFEDIDNAKYLYEYVKEFIKTILFILKSQTTGGITIIKIAHTFYKPIIDLLYILSTLYEKIFIIKPNTSNIISYEKYIVCINYNRPETELKGSRPHTENNPGVISSIMDFNFSTSTSTTLYEQLTMFYKNYKKTDIVPENIIQNKIPLYFINKLNDVNIILGQKQLAMMDHLIFILKNKQKDKKIDLLKKQNIQKCISWCKKHKMHYQIVYQSSTNISKFSYNQW